MRTAFLMTALTVLLVLVGDYFGGALRYDDDAYHLPRHESIFVLEQR